MRLIGKKVTVTTVSGIICRHSYRCEACPMNYSDEGLISSETIPIASSEPVKVTSHFSLGSLGRSSTSMSLSGIGNPAWIGELFQVGSTHLPPLHVGTTSNWSANNAARAMISVLAKCRPGHNT